MAWAEVTPSLAPTGSEAFSSLALSRDGQKLIVALDDGGTHLVRRYTRASGAWGSPELLYTATYPVVLGNSKVATNGDGSVVVISLADDTDPFAPPDLIVIQGTSVVQSIPAPAGAPEATDIALDDEGTTLVVKRNDSSAHVRTYDGTPGSMAETSSFSSSNLRSLSLTADGLGLSFADTASRMRTYTRTGTGSWGLVTTWFPNNEFGALNLTWVRLSSDGSALLLSQDVDGSTPAVLALAGAFDSWTYGDYVPVEAASLALSGDGLTAVAIDVSSPFHIRTFGAEPGPASPPVPPAPSGPLFPSDSRFPAELPPFFRTGHSFQDQGVAEDVPFEQGEDRSRQIYTFNAQVVSVSVELTQAQFDRFDAWFEDELQAGSLRFDVLVQRQGSPDGVSWWACQFVGVPKWEAFGWYYTINAELLLLDGPYDSRTAPGLRGLATQGTQLIAQPVVDLVLRGLATQSTELLGELLPLTLYGLAVQSTELTAFAGDEGSRITEESEQRLTEDGVVRTLE